MGDHTITLLEKALDLRELRHKLIASNIANVNTPGYRCRDISFEKQLRSAAASSGPGLVRTHSRHLPAAGSLSSIRPEIVTPAQTINNDLNSVDLDRELVKLSRNNVLYNALVTVLRKKMDAIKYAIREGGR